MDKTEKKGVEDEIIINTPQDLRPEALPLVVTPAKGKNWKNKEQEEYAMVINGYAYKNPTKFKQKKDKLIANLKELETNPTLIYSLRGLNEDEKKLRFSNKVSPKTLQD